MFRRLLSLVLVPVAVAGCTSLTQAVPSETVTVTVTSAPVERPSKAPEMKPPAQTPPPSPRDPSEHPPFGLIVSSAEKMCVPPVNALPDLVTNGDSSEYVDALQMAMYLLGYDVNFTSSYDPNTVKVVQRMQADLGVVPDGQVGPITWGALRDRHCPEWQDYFSNAEDYEVSVPGGEAPAPQASTPAPQYAAPSTPDFVQVPNVLGLTFRDAEQVLKNLGLTPTFKTAMRPCPVDAPDGWVAYTTPPPGSMVTRLSWVNLTLTCGNN